MRYIVALFAFLAAFTGTAMAASATVAVADVSPDASWIDLAKPVLEAVRAGNGWLAAALALVLLTTAGRKYGASRWPWLSSKAGGALLNLLLSFGGMAATALAAGTLPSWALAATALKVSLAAAGGFTLIKELAAPALRWLESKAPAWLRPWLAPAINLALWAFEGKGKAAVAKAEAAGQAAVEAKPAAGAEGVTGKHRRIP